MSEKIVVPALGESINEATIAKWLKNKGDIVSADEPIVELETDKVNLEVPSPVSGTLSKINSKDGSTVEVGAVLGEVTESDSENKVIEKIKTSKSGQKKEENNVVNLDIEKRSEPSIFEEKEVDSETLVLTNEISKEKSSWKLTTSTKEEFLSPNIVIAGGVGSFEPRKFSVKECEKFENDTVLYSIKDKSIFNGKIVSIFGGGDSALDWAIELSKNSKVILVHRRDEFRGAPSSLNKVKQLEKENKIELFTKYQLSKVSGDKKPELIEIKHDDSTVKSFKTDYLLGFFGLIMQLGPILDWGLNVDKKTIPVNTENFETNQKGIFAIGDICSYPGKLKLILSGFHEGALAARGCFKYARPDEKLKFEFTTTSKSIRERLGKSN